MHVVVLTPIAIDVVTLEAYELEIRRRNKLFSRYIDLYAGLEDECYKWIKERNLNKYFENRVN